MPLTIFFPTAGTYTIEDDGIRGNGTSQVRDGSGAVLTSILHPGDTIDFIAEVPGIGLTFNTLDTFGTANVTVGNLTASADTPDSITLKSLRNEAFMTLVSNGSITEGGSDTAADAIAAGVIMSAATGIGTGGNAIETQLTFLEAETTTGGINIANFGGTQLGGLTADVSGLSAGAGDINFSTVGLILLADTSGGFCVQGSDISGNVTLSALGADSDIFTNISQKAVSAGGGGITLNAGRDVMLGTGGTNFDNDLLATNFVSIHAGRDFVLDGTSDIRTGAFGGVVGGNIEIEAGRNISLTNTTGGLQTIQAFAGDVILTTGAGGGFFETGGFPGAIQTTNDIFLNADTVQIGGGGLNTTGIGSVTIVPVTPGRAIDIGSTLDGTAALGISDGELDLLFTLNVSIGDLDSGPVHFSAPISPFIVDNLTVRSGTEILVGSSITLPRSLTLRAGDDVFFTGGGSLTTSSSDPLKIFVDLVQNDGGTGGTADLSNGLFSGFTATEITGNKDSDTLTGSFLDDTLNGGDSADTMAGWVGNDTYIVDDAGDVVNENLFGSDGFDVVRASVSFNLSDAADVIGTVEDLTLTGTAAINGTGNSVANTLIGNVAANILDGHEDADFMRGLGGDDTYVVDNAGDEVDEVTAGSGGTDTVLSSISFSLSGAVVLGTVENLTLTGTADINATGAGGKNILTGNAGANTLNGKGGADTMSALGGDDTYVVDKTGDVVDEGVAGSDGDDTVQSSITFNLSDTAHAKGMLENLLLTGNTDINGTGSAVANTLVGNGGVNVLNGRAGSDTLSGAAGNDTFRFTTALDAASNVDRITDFDVDGAGTDSFDTIELENGVFTLLTATGDLAAGKFAVVANAADADNGSTITYVSSTGKLYYDINGAAVGGETLFAKLTAGLALTNADFFVT